MEGMQLSTLKIVFFSFVLLSSEAVNESVCFMGLFPLTIEGWKTSTKEVVLFFLIRCTYSHGTNDSEKSKKMELRMCWGRTCGTKMGIFGSCTLMKHTSPS